MTADEKLVENILQKHAELKSTRKSFWDSNYQECKDVVWPNSMDFITNRVQGTNQLTEMIYDSTAQWANGQFANGMHAVLVNPTDRWFSLATADTSLADDDLCLSWCEKVSDLIYRIYNDPYVNHRQSIHESFLSLGCLGTAVLFQDWSDKRRLPIFKSIPLAQCFIAESEDGLIDTVYRDVKVTLRQAKQRFGEKNLPKKMLEKKDTDEVNFVHAVYPREERDITSMLSKDMPFASEWVSIEFKEVVWQKGFTTFPYHVSRWEKIPGQVYGRSPAMTCLSDIKMLNQMKKVTLEAAQKVVNPPMLTPSDAFLNQFDMTPGAINEYDSSMGLDVNAIRPFMSGARPDLGDKMMAPIRDAIIHCFYADVMDIPFKKERQTTTEINERRNDSLRNIAPLVGRQEAELLGPKIQRTFDLLNRNRMIPPIPAKMSGAKLKITYISQANIAQMGSKLDNIRSFIAQALVPLMQMAPEVKDFVDLDETLNVSGKYGNVTRDIFRSPEDVAAIRKDKAQQAAAQAQQQQLESGSAALKNVGQAIQAAPSLAGQ